MRRLYFSLLIIAILAFITCTSQPETYTVETIGGVRHVHNITPLWGDEQKIELEFVQKIGELETEDENYQLYQPQDVALDSEGNVYILDKGNFRIQKYDRNGKFILSFGKKGQGPGEFSIAYQIIVSPEDEIYVFDIRLSHGYHVFNKNGEYRRIFNRDNLNFNIEAILMSGNYTVSDANPDSEALIKIVDQYLNTIKEIGKKRLYDTASKIRAMNSYALSLTDDHCFFIAYVMKNLIEKYSPEGRHILSFDRSLPYEETEDSYPIEGGDLTRNLFSTSIQTDHRNRVWITTLKDQLKRGEPGNLMFEIFNEDGVLLTRMDNELLAARTVFKIYDDRLFIVDTHIGHCVYEYRIVEK
ncbi:6-bladed beta-propeller [candidate division KSB1 bacterium]